MGELRTSGRTRPVAAAVTDVGRQRKHNEDNVLVKSELGLFVVADGMGGHNAGNVASALATRSLDNFFEATQSGELPGPIPADEVELDPEARRIVAGIRKANLDVFVISSTHAQHQGMGSTVVAAYVSSETDQIHIGHVGDSRCYRIRDGVIEQLTKDHSLINDALALKPDLSPEELSRLPKNIITRALGMKDAVKVDVRSERILPGDIYLLCSDGLTGMVAEPQILEVFDITDEPREACELLIAMANDAGGTDNISALIVRIDTEVREHRDLDRRRAETTQPHRIDEMGSVLPPEADDEMPRVDEIDLDPEIPAIDASLAAAEEHGASADGSERHKVADPAGGEPMSEPVRSPPVTPAAFTDRRSRAAAGSGRYAAVQAGSRSAAPDTGGQKPKRVTEVRVARCTGCNHELFIGNKFCVECGTPIKP